MRILLVLFLLSFSALAPAAVEYRAFSDPDREQTYQTLISELRCLVCQNQTIADSNADLAKDLRQQVYEMLQQGKSQQQIVDFMTQRYGDFVLYRPAFNIKTGLLWMGPVLFLLIGLIAVIVIARRNKTTTQPLDAAQQKHLHAILEKGDDE